MTACYTPPGRLVYRYASLAVAAAGAYWLVERIRFE
jgi:hypothetical protein